MQQAIHVRAVPPADFFYTGQAADTVANIDHSEQHRSVDRQFISMLDAYRTSGGLARLQELAAFHPQGIELDIAQLAGSISRRELICFEWQSHAWLPLFQFDPSDMTPHLQLRAIVSELSCVYGPWDLALWFSQPNPWLADQAPADICLTDLKAVVQAARADRFAATG